LIEDVKREVKSHSAERKKKECDTKERSLGKKQKKEAGYKRKKQRSWSKRKKEKIKGKT